MRIALAQLNSVLGDVDANLARAREVVVGCRADACDVVVFPELFLAGPKVGGSDEDLSMESTDPRLLSLAEAGGPTASVVGFVQSGRRDNLFDSAAYLVDGRVAHVHQKLYLVTYDIFEEGKYFTAGSSMRAFDTAQGRMAIMVCNDAWQPPLAFVAVQDGAQVLLISANSGDSSFDAVLDTRSSWEQITRFYASIFQCYVVFVNRVGHEGPLRFWGGSHVVDPWGHVIAQAPLYDETVMTVDIDRSLVRRRRRQVPFLKESRLDLLTKELTRLMRETGDE